MTADGLGPSDRDDRTSTPDPGNAATDAEPAPVELGARTLRGLAQEALDALQADDPTLAADALERLLAMLR